MIILESLLTTFKGSWGSSENWQLPKTFAP